MKFRSCAPLLVALMLVVAVGCQSNKKRLTQKEEAQKRWNSARAAVLGSLAKGQLEAGNFEKSRQTLEEAQRLDPENPSLRILYAKLAIEQNLLDVADRELRAARELDPKNAEADYLSGVVYQRWQKSQTALDYYTSAAEKDPKELSYILAQAEMLVVLGRQEDALMLLQKRLEDFSNHAALHDTIGQLFMTQGEYALAVDALRQAHILSSDDLIIREHLARAHFYNRQYRDAANHINRILQDEKNAGRAELYVMLGECQLSLGRPRDARQSLEKATELSPSMPTAWLCLTKASLELNDLRRAETSLRKGMSLAPQNSEAHLILGYVRLRQERLDEALAAFQKAHALDSSDPLSLCMIGYVMEKTGKRQQAMQYYARALQLRPQDELATKLMASINAGD